MTATADTSPLGLTTHGSGLVERLAGLLGTVLTVRRVDPDAHFFDDLGADSMLLAQFCARVRKQPGMPKISMKDVYANPTLRSLAARATPAEVVLEGVPDPLGEVLAGVLKIGRVDPDAHFFDDLGADSMLLAQFCARVRKQPGMPKISMKDVYANPTLRSLSTAMVPAGPAPIAAAAPAAVGETPPTPDAPPARSEPRRPGALAHFLCGLAQLTFLLGTVFLGGTLAVVGYQWVEGGRGFVAGYLRLVGFLAASYLLALCSPLAAKWILIGRWTPREFPAWGLTYFRFWVAKTILARNPVVATLVGSPLYPLYLRALGARIGPGTAIFSRQVALCPDLFSVGAGTVIRKGAVAQCYRAHNGTIQTGRVHLGSSVVVGEAAVLDIDCAIGDRGQLGHASALHRGERVPAGEAWHGSPAAFGTTDFALVPDVACTRRRRLLYGTFQVLGTLFVTGPLTVGLTMVLAVASLWASGLPLTGQGDMSGAAFWGQALAMSALLVFGGLLVAAVLVLTVPAFLHRFVRAGAVAPLYGTQYALHRAIARLSNVKRFTRTFGDSSAITGYLQAIGYYLAPVQQTGTNFGVTVVHDNPRLVRVGPGTVVADGLTILNAEISATSIRLSQTHIGANNFLGNSIAYPARGRTGDNCLLATKVMVPIDGPVREGVGLLGSPAFEIPRLVARDADLALTDPTDLATALRAKNRHNALTVAFDLSRLVLTAFLLVVCAQAAAGPHTVFGPASYGLAAVVLFLGNLALLLTVHRAVAHLAVRCPEGCSIYARTFWRHERYWKLGGDAPQVFAGTPFRPWLWRALGVRMGRRALDDGIGLAEKSFVTVGDFATFNAGSVVQTHSQENGAFKSEVSRLGHRVTLGVGAFVHYGVSIGDDAEIAPDSFVMKGEEVPALSFWGGNPAAAFDQAEAKA